MIEMEPAMINAEWQLNGMILGGVAALAGLVYCVLNLAQRRRISDQVSIYLTGALLSVVVGCKLMNIWLGINFRPEFYDFQIYMRWKEGLFAAVPFWAMIYLFTAVTGYYLILATGRMVQEHRRKVLTWATRTAYGAAILAMVATLLLTWVLWDRPISELEEKLDHERMVTHESTERYLTDWLEEEPDSPHAQQLYRASKGEYPQQDTEDPKTPEFR
jgi:hypothetical protein